MNFIIVFNKREERGDKMTIGRPKEYPPNKERVWFNKKIMEFAYWLGYQDGQNNLTKENVS